MEVSTEDFMDQVSQSVYENTACIEYDFEGQIVIYTGMYKWANGKIHTHPECMSMYENVERQNQQARIDNEVKYDRIDEQQQERCCNEQQRRIEKDEYQHEYQRQYQRFF